MCQNMSSVLADPQISFNTLPLGPLQGNEGNKKEELATLSSNKLLQSLQLRKLGGFS